MKESCDLKKWHWNNDGNEQGGKFNLLIFSRKEILQYLKDILTTNTLQLSWHGKISNKKPFSIKR